MEKEKLIHWRNVHSPLLYDLARHIDGSFKYWVTSVQELGKKSSKINRAKKYLELINLEERDFLILKIDNNHDLKNWEQFLEDEKWNLSLRAHGFGILIHKQNTERKNLILGGMLGVFIRYLVTKF